MKWLNRSNNKQIIAWALLTLFVLLIAFCPVKRILFPGGHAPALYQKAKIAAVHQTKDAKVIAASSVQGLCGADFVQFKHSLKTHPAVSFDFAFVATFLFVAIWLFKPLLSRLTLKYAHFSDRTESVPLFIRYRLLLI